MTGRLNVAFEVKVSYIFDWKVSCQWSLVPLQAKILSITCLRHRNLQNIRIGILQIFVLIFFNESATNNLRQILDKDLGKVVWFWSIWPYFWSCKNNHNKRFGEFEFEYFGDSDVVNKLNTYISRPTPAVCWIDVITLRCLFFMQVHSFCYFLKNNFLTKVSFFVQCIKKQLTTLQNFNV